MIPTQTLKDYAFAAQTNPGTPLPVQVVTMCNASGIPHMDIVKAQLELARAADPNIPEISYEVTVRQRVAAEDATGRDLEAFSRLLQNASIDAADVIDRSQLYRQGRAVFNSEYAKNNPANSVFDFFTNLRGDKNGGRVEVDDETLVTLAAIMYGESGTSGFDSAERITPYERSFGRFQINTLVQVTYLKV